MPALQAGTNSSTYALIVGGVNYTTWNDVTQTFWSESGAELPAQFECVIASGEVSGKTITAGFDFTGLEIYLTDLANSRKLFGGYVDDMELEHGAGSVVYYHLRAVSFDALLDRQSIVRWRSAVNITAKRVRWMATDREMVQSVVAQYGFDLTANNTNVASTNAAMPKLTLKSVTLRDALQAIAEAASSKSDQALRRFYVDFDKKLHYFKTNEGTSAPYKIGDREYDGSTIIPDYIKYGKNVADAAKKVYVKGSNNNGTGWVIKSTGRPYDRIDIVDIPESDSAAAMGAMGAAYLNREAAPVRGGMFTVTGFDGWRAGQTVNVRNSAFGLNENFQIREIEADPNMGAGVTTYDISYGALPWRGTDMLPRKKRSNNSTGRTGGGTGGGGGSGSGTGSDGSSDGGSDTTCFVAGTIVDTPNGGKPIEQLRVGDAVYAVEEETMRLVPGKVSAVIPHLGGTEPRLSVTFANDESIEVTVSHRFFDPLCGDYHPIKDFAVGDVVLDYSSGSAKELWINDIEELGNDPTDVFNIEVETYHTYLVNGVLVHNAKPVIL